MASSYDQINDSRNNVFAHFWRQEGTDVPDSYRGQGDGQRAPDGSLRGLQTHQHYVNNEQNHLLQDHNCSQRPPLLFHQHKQQRQEPEMMSSEHTARYRERNREGNNDRGLSFVLSGSKYPRYKEDKERIASYIRWSDNLKPPKIMSKSGLFSTQNGDCVRCFHCGIGLRHWDPEDDPWVEHARWSSKCEYLRQLKGEAFINLVQEAVRQAEIEETLAQNSRTNTDTTNDTECDGGDRQTSECDGTNHRSDKSRSYNSNPLLTPAAQSVLEMGYLPKFVKEAVDKVIINKGWKNLTGQNIMEVIFEMESENDGKATMKKQEKCDDTADRNKSVRYIKDTQKLREENEELKEMRMCKICCEATVSIVFLPCGHLVCCGQCAPALKDCPICRTRVKATVRIQMR